MTVLAPVAPGDGFVVVDVGSAVHHIGSTGEVMAVVVPLAPTVAALLAPAVAFGHSLALVCVVETTILAAG